MTKLASKNLKQSYSKNYSKFEKIDGSHPLKDYTINSYLEYQARTRHGGKVAAFNYALAKEIGLISSSHPHEMNTDLERQILDAFALVIINEYDIKHKIEFPKEDIRKNKYMATRYLQLQHPNKQGKTSGDGRSIWNGTVSHKGKMWDISSCGTGATALSPATHIKKKFFQTGDPSISYGCGYSEIDEGYTSLIFSEVLNQNHIETERVLAVIEFEKNFSITVRVHNNLLRPSHFFNHLKQNNYDALEAMVNYYIMRQEQNESWTEVPKTKKSRYKYFLKMMASNFAKTVARFEDEYIFCWLDWDGDNILMDGGIIDYGSVRQFGLFHSEYRYDDVQRYSTTIVEQKSKAKYIVQSFIQAIDYLIQKEKKQINEFAKHEILDFFESEYDKYKQKNLLYRLGFCDALNEKIHKTNLSLIENFRKTFSYFEKAKSKLGMEEVPDGINWNAIFCMRDILRELPQIYLARGIQKISHKEFLEIIKSSYATEEDLHLSSNRKKKIDEFQTQYLALIQVASKMSGLDEFRILLNLSMRSSIINKYDRVTGDSITTIVDMLVKKKSRMSCDDLYSIIEQFVEYQNLDPNSKNNHVYPMNNLMKKIFNVVKDYREGL